MFTDGRLKKSFFVHTRWRHEGRVCLTKAKKGGGGSIRKGNILVYMKSQRAIYEDRKHENTRFNKAGLVIPGFQM